MKLYNTNYIITEMKDETKINLFAENEFYDKVQIAHFDFYYNEGWVMDLKGNKKDVKRHATIMNYLFKQNFNLGWDSAKVEQAKKNAKKLKLDETKAHKAELQEKDEQKALDMINGIKDWNEKYINICKATEKKTDDELIKSIEFTFKNASKKTLKEVFAVIRNYDSFVKIKKKEEATEVVSPIENQEEKSNQNTKMESYEDSTRFIFNRQNVEYATKEYNSLYKLNVSYWGKLKNKEVQLDDNLLDEMIKSNCDFWMDVSNDFTYSSDGLIMMTITFGYIGTNQFYGWISKEYYEQLKINSK